MGVRDGDAVTSVNFRVGFYSGAGNPVMYDGRYSSFREARRALAESSARLPEGSSSNHIFRVETTIQEERSES